MKSVFEQLTPERQEEVRKHAEQLAAEAGFSEKERAAFYTLCGMPSPDNGSGEQK